MVSKIARQLFDVYTGIALSIFSRYPIGTNVFDRDWDALVLLDTCRVDALREVAPEYEFLSTVDSMVSVGSTSSEWMACTFVDEYRDEISETIYVSANGFDKEIFEVREMPDEKRGPSWADWSTVAGDDFLKLDQVWKYAPEPDKGHVRPNFVTDRAIANAREHDPDRLVVHYSQPHEPYIANFDDSTREDLYEYEQNPWRYLKNGGDFETVWDSYLDNLRMVLDEVAVLLENVDAETVAISADHGEAFGGKWGVNRHRLALPHPKMKRVPWAVTTAEDSGRYEPTLEPTDGERDVEEHLSELGYV